MRKCGHYYRSIMLRELPARVDLAELVTGAKRLSGSVSLAALPRLVELLENSTGTIDATLEFYGHRSGQPTARGSVDAKLDLQCQRCLEPVSVPISSTFEVTFVQSEDELGNLQQKIEPWLTDGDILELNRLVEEEVILAMPAIPVHRETSDCGKLIRQLESYTARGQATSTDRPFDKLKGLLSNSQSGEK